MIQAYLLLEMSYELALPLGGKYLIDAIIPSGKPRNLLIFLGILLAIYLLNPILGTHRAYLTVEVNQKVRNDLQLKVFSRLLYLPHSFYAHMRVADIAARLSSDMGVVSSAVKAVMQNGLYSAISVLVAAITMLLLDAPLALLFVAVPLSVTANVVLSGRLRQLTFAQQTLAGDTSAFVQEHLQAHPVIKAFGLGQAATASYRTRLHTLLLVSTRLGLVEAICDEGVLLALAIGHVLILGVGGYLVMEKQLSVGTLLAFIGLLGAVFTPIETLISVSQTVQMASGALARITELLDEPVTIQDKASALPLPALAGEVRLEHVSAGYEDGRSVLHDVSLTIAPGSHVAVVGPSGSGKSTLINLLLRFWDPQQGSITVDGHDLRDLTLASLRGQIGIVFQDAVVFDTTLRANIAVGRPSATDVEIAAAARAARLDDVISALPTGFDTLLGEEGVRLSGGQRQRLSLARVYLRQPRILVLDEATSALDVRTEKEIVATLAQFVQGVTTINITHRLALATWADTIVVLDQGRIVEHGPHTTLVRAGGLYQRLYEEQMSLPTDDRLSVGAEEARLRAIPLFAGLSDEGLAIVAGQVGRERVDAGVDVVRQGDAGDKLYIIARGHVDVLVRSDSGTHDGLRRINGLDEGNYFGEMALLAGAPRNATVRATVQTELITLSQHAFIALLDRHPELRPIIERNLAQRRAGLGMGAPPTAPQALTQPLLDPA